MNHVLHAPRSWNFERLVVSSVSDRLKHTPRRESTIPTACGTRTEPRDFATEENDVTCYACLGQKSMDAARAVSVRLAGQPIVLEEKNGHVVIRDPDGSERYVKIDGAVKVTGRTERDL